MGFEDINVVSALLPQLLQLTPQPTNLLGCTETKNTYNHSSVLVHALTIPSTHIAAYSHSLLTSNISKGICYCKKQCERCTIINLTLDFISSFQKHCVILFLQFSDVAKSLVQYHVLTL